MPLPSERAAAFSELWQADTDRHKFENKEQVVDAQGNILSSTEIYTRYNRALRFAFNLERPGEVDNLLEKNMARLEGTTFSPDRPVERRGSTPL